MELTPRYLLAALLLVGCGEDARTEVIVVVDTDLEVPAELDALAIVVTGPDDETQNGGGAIAASDLPATLGLVHEGGPLGPFSVVARGTLTDALVVERRARFTFVEGETLVLLMHLTRACATTTCGADQSCTERGCEPIDVPPERLGAWTGTPPRLGETPGTDAGTDAATDAGPDAGPIDAGPPDGSVDACISGAEMCNMMDDDCDGMIDEGFDGIPETCNMADDDCDGMVDEGLEGTPETCDMVDDDCDGTVDEGTSTIPETCNMVDDDCDGMVDEDFDLTTDPMNCSACGTSCIVRNGTGACTGGACVIASCNAGFDDCDADFGTGCEADLNMSAMHCGACRNECRNPERNCCAGVCMRSCP